MDEILLCLFLNDLFKIPTAYKETDVARSVEAWLAGDGTETFELFLGRLEKDLGALPSELTETAGRLTRISSVLETADRGVGKRRFGHAIAVGTVVFHGAATQDSPGSEDRRPPPSQPDLGSPPSRASGPAPREQPVTRFELDVSHRTSTPVNRTAARQIIAQSDRANSALVQVEDCYEQAKNEYGDDDGVVEVIRELRDLVKEQCLIANREAKKEYRNPGAGCLDDAEEAASSAAADALKAMARLKAKRKREDREV